MVCNIVYTLLTQFSDKLYIGDVIYTYAFGRSLIILNSVDAARDLLDKRSANFSDRPASPIIDM